MLRRYMTAAQERRRRIQRHVLQAFQPRFSVQLEQFDEVFVRFGLTHALVCVENASKDDGFAAVAAEDSTLRHVGVQLIGDRYDLVGKAEPLHVFENAPFLSLARLNAGRIFFSRVQVVSPLPVVHNVMLENYAARGARFHTASVFYIYVSAAVPVVRISFCFFELFEMFEVFKCCVK